MLGQRIVTAVVLLAILLPSLLAASTWPFAVVTLMLIGAAGWEWGRLNGLAQAGSLGLGAVLVVFGIVALQAQWPATTPAGLWWAAAGVWVVGGGLALRAGPAGWPRLSPSLRRVLGLVGLAVAWLALAHARGRGLNFILSVFCLVWMADIAAYFGGRRFGRRKLAPSISPGKSWEGVWSGLLGVAVLGVAWAWADTRVVTDSPSLYTMLDRRWGLVGACLALMVLAGLSVVGDLVESLVKRASGVKDSSRLLPGHGGVLDRVDALLPVFPVALAVS